MKEEPREEEKEIELEKRKKEEKKKEKIVDVGREGWYASYYMVLAAVKLGGNL